ncbi:LytTR family DNA-binding domain-containing protein [Ulvibacterium sp.]|uniref:LytR/AlgR family response regulator transcription factor n=1 Tax=Ulvibacterium sp. TaxID=2665914 RepID=UPI00260393EB|nr:LytTR family DNA-binding domain-containing protein [Ulvibacterium sp.]
MKNHWPNKTFIGLPKIGSRIKTGLVLILVSLVANHLSESRNFPFSSSYNFPLFTTIVSIILGTLVLLIADFNFNFYKRTYFKESVTAQNLINFLLSTLVYIAIGYIPVYLIVIWLKGAAFSFYHLLSGLSITLLLSSIGIAIFFAKDVYKLHKLVTLTGKIPLKRGEKTIFVGYNEIAYAYSENKITYITRTNGTTLAADPTLNELEEKLPESLFFRANRQTIVHFQSISNTKIIENGKLLAVLEPGSSGLDYLQITISRYKKKAFEEWLRNKHS